MLIVYLFGSLVASASDSDSESNELKCLFVCYRLLVIMWFLFGKVSSSSLAWDYLRYFSVALCGPSKPIISKPICKLTLITNIQITKR